MKRREFIAGALATGVLSRSASAAEPSAAVKQVVRDYYSVYYTDLDKKKYRSLLTGNYFLLEDGEIMDADADIALMPAPADGYRRMDTFDFRSVNIHADTAYAIYFLQSAITDKKDGTRNLKWLESAILRRTGSKWQVAVLHSTRITKAPA